VPSSPAGATQDAGGTTTSGDGGLTVPDGDGTTTGGTTSGGSGGGGVTTGGGGTTSGSGGGVGSSGGGTGSGGSGGGSGTGGTGGGGSGPGPRVSVSAPGITPTKIYFGATYQTDQGAANSSIFGAGALNTGDARDYYDVVADDINAHGGVAGRKLVPVYAQIAAASAQTVDQQYQSACYKWTKDNKVFVIIEAARSVVPECAKKAGAFQLDDPLPSSSVPEDFVDYPHYVEIGGINMVRQGPATVDGLAEQGYFDRGARIGIVTWDDPKFHETVDKGYVPALKQHGKSLSIETAYVHVPANAQDVGGTSADVSSAVLRFSNEHIDHVFLLDGTAGVCGGACLTLLFTRQAESQQYRPRYGFNENNSPGVLLDQGLMPPEQARRSLAVLWSDFDKTSDAGWKLNPARESCFALMRKHGIKMDNSSAQGVAMAACSELWFFRLTMDKVAGTLSTDSLMDAIENIGGSYTDTISYATYFDQDRHDGLAAVRNAAFVNGCTCYRYSTRPYRV
jgi:hypothetical protein